MSTDRDESIMGVSSLAEPQRRALYRFVVDRGQPVGKDEAAEALGIARTVAGIPSRPARRRRAADHRVPAPHRPPGSWRRTSGKALSTGASASSR